MKVVISTLFSQLYPQLNSPYCVAISRQQASAIDFLQFRDRNISCESHANSWIENRCRIIQNAYGLRLVVKMGLLESTWNLALDAWEWLETTACQWNSSSPSISTRQILRSHCSDGNYYPKNIVSLQDLLLSTCHTTKPESIPGRQHNICYWRILCTWPSYDYFTTRHTFWKVFGCLPTPPLQRDLVIIEHKLESFAEKIWRKQGFM